MCSSDVCMDKGGWTHTPAETSRYTVCTLAKPQTSCLKHDVQFKYMSHCICVTILRGLSLVCYFYVQRCVCVCVYLSFFSRLFMIVSLLRYEMRVFVSVNLIISVRFRFTLCVSVAGFSRDDSDRNRRRNRHAKGYRCWFLFVILFCFHNFCFF